MSDEKDRGRKIIQEAPKSISEATKGWEDLNRRLNFTFEREHNHNGQVWVFLHEYKIKEQDIRDVLEEKNYNVSVDESGGERYLIVTLKN